MGPRRTTAVSSAHADRNSDQTTVNHTTTNTTTNTTSFSTIDKSQAQTAAQSCGVPDGNVQSNYQDQSSTQNVITSGSGNTVNVKQTIANSFGEVDMDQETCLMTSLQQQWAEGSTGNSVGGASDVTSSGAAGSTSDQSGEQGATATSSADPGSKKGKGGNNWIMIVAIILVFFLSSQSLKGCLNPRKLIELITNDQDTVLNIIILILSVLVITQLLN